MEDRLDARRIRNGMETTTRPQLRFLTLLEEVDSTNAYLARLPGDQQHAHAVLAESQEMGRGRRRRQWHSPAGGNIYFSLGWQFNEADSPLSTLPLVVAICVCKALSGAGLASHGIKWPNDILVDGRKLAGILVEVQSTGTGPALAVVGMGLNVRMPGAGTQAIKSAIDQPWTDLASSMPPGHEIPSRNQLVALLLEALLPALAHYAQEGFDAFRADWEELDLLHGNRLELDVSGKRLAGRSRGIDPLGGLLLESGDGEVRAFHSGEVRVFHD
jgi:BirA family biotin operon repressor/biotin-[acetyl-CoA-carboxylase] ligase